MQSIEFNGTLRAVSGKQENKTLKREGRIPCVIYGGGENIHFSVCAKEVKNLIYTPNSYIINFNIDGKIEKVVLREVQYHPVYEQILHMDFFRVIEGKPVVIDVPVKLTGNSEGVKLGGKLVLSKRKIKIAALEENLPDFIEIDTTSMGLGTSKFVRDLVADNYSFVTPGTTAVCAVNMTRAARGAAAAAANASNTKKKK